LQRVTETHICARNVIACYGMGITRHRIGSANVQQILNQLLPSAA
jgi:predicted molibdopterin-dependent oxidoreductase YjgC